MSALMDRPDDNFKNEKRENLYEERSPYYNYSINDLLDERNYLKNMGLSTEEVDKELSKRN